ncbi:MAG: NRDE family protein [Sphingomonadaceae bacterium]|nr:NRDE family protein [Sphingomonadaceae bacterium]
MCVVAVAWRAHPEWHIIVAGNRDEFHARQSAPLSHWEDQTDIIAGRDLVSGGSWMGVSTKGRFAVVTNIRSSERPDPDKCSRGALVADWLGGGLLPDNGDCFNPFNLLASDQNGAMLLSNRPAHTLCTLDNGIYGLSNAIPDEHWPRKDRLTRAMNSWLADEPHRLDLLLDMLGEEKLPDQDAYPIFIHNPVYGTRCSTVVAVRPDGRGRIIERRFDSDGQRIGETSLDFNWAM